MPISPPRAKAALYSKPFSVLALSNFLMISGVGCNLVYPLFILHIGGTKSDIGILMGAMSLAAVACRPWASELIDRVGRFRSYGLGCGLMALVSLLHIGFQQPLAAVFWPLLGLRLVFGVGFALAMIAGLTWAADLIPPSRFNEGIGLFGVTGLLGIALGPMAAEGIIHRFGFPQMFVFAGLITGGALLIALGAKDAYSRSAPSSRDSFFQTLRQGPLLRITIIALCFGFGFAAHGSFVAPYAQSQSLLVSTYFMAYSAAAIAARLSVGRIADRIGERRLIPYALILTGAGFGSLIWAQSPSGLCLSGLITGLGHGVLFPSMLAVAVCPVAPHNRGKANGVFTGGVDSGVFLGSVMLGIIGQHLGFSALFATAGAALLLGLGIFWVTTRRACPQPGGKMTP
jgi:MFS family permease